MTPSSARRVLVTGSSGALGAAVCARFEKDGWTVVTADSKGGGVDLSDPTAVKALKAKAGSLDAVVHCAGGFRYSSLDGISDQDWDFLLRSNLTSSLLLLREFLPEMKKTGSGALVFIGSKAALTPGAGMGPYSAAKAGLHALVQSAAEECKGSNVRVNAVLPSILDTPANRKDMPGADTSKWVSTAALAEIIQSLCAPWGQPLTGALIPVTGGV